MSRKNFDFEDVEYVDFEEKKDVKSADKPEEELDKLESGIFAVLWFIPMMIGGVLIKLPLFGIGWMSSRLMKKKTTPEYRL